MHIPIRMGFVRNNGSVMPVTLEGDNATGPDERVIELTQAEQNFIFVGVDEPPLLSLGRRFSAPIHIRAPLNRKARAQLMASDPDAFNRWESGQALASDILLHMAAASQKGAPLQTDPSYVAAMGEVLRRAEDDPAFAALMLTPPSESELAIVMMPADPDAIHAARVALIREVATAWHKDAFAGAVQECRPERRLRSGRRCGRQARVAQCLPALPHRRGRRGGRHAGRCALSRRQQHDRHDRRPRRPQPHAVGQADSRVRRFP